jgi:SAM-dependent methyltransferase
LFKILANNEVDNSLSTQLRRKRFAIFSHLLSKLSRPVSILDIGGTEGFWSRMGLLPAKDVHITLLNVGPLAPSSLGFVHVIGDARCLPFPRQSFDVVFSNSVIEHVGDLSDQRRMAAEIQRVSWRYFVQTPNRYFPIEPHFVFPLFQFLPIPFRAWLHYHFHLGWYPRAANYAAALEDVRSIRLLSMHELRSLFSSTYLYQEKIFLLPKSFILTSGWD